MKYTYKLKKRNYTKQIINFYKTTSVVNTKKIVNTLINGDNYE